MEGQAFLIRSNVYHCINNVRAMSCCATFSNMLVVVDAPRDLLFITTGDMTRIG